MKDNTMVKGVQKPGMQEDERATKQDVDRIIWWLSEVNHKLVQINSNLKVLMEDKS